MKKHSCRKRFLALATAMIIMTLTICGSVTQVSAGVAVKWPTAPQINSPSAIVMEVNTGTILYEKNSHEELYPASITKILTTLLALENNELSDIVTFGPTAVYKNEGNTSHIARDLGEQMTVEQTLYAVMLESANECAYQIAETTGEKLGGDVNTFIKMMNDRAEALGCTNTHFNNPNGLPDPEHYTSSYDFALISCEAYKNEKFREITGTKTYIIPPTNKHSVNTVLNNHHKILHFYRSKEFINPYCTGGKTGYTSVANNTLVTYAEKDGIVLCVVIMNALNTDHFQDTNTLIDYCFSNFQTYYTSDSDTSLQTENAKNYGLLNENRGFITIDSNSYLILPKEANFSDVEVEQTESSSEDALAMVSYSYDGHIVGQAKIVANENLELAPSLFTRTNELMSEVMSTELEESTGIASRILRVKEYLRKSQEAGKTVIVVSPLALVALVVTLLIILLILLILIRLILFIRRAKREKLEGEQNPDWRKDPRRRKRMRKNRRMLEKRRKRAEQRAAYEAARAAAEGTPAEEKPEEDKQLEEIPAEETPIEEKPAEEQAPIEEESLDELPDLGILEEAILAEAQEDEEASRDE